MREAITVRTMPVGARARLARGHAMRAPWQGRTLRAQLLTLFVVIELIAAAIAGAVTILNARSATRVEIAASMELAELWVKEAVLLAQREAPADRFLTDLSSQLHRVRHVRIEVKDFGRPAARGPSRCDRAGARRSER